MGTILINTENSKTNEPHKFALNLSQRLDLRSSNKYYSSKLVYLLHLDKYKTTAQKQTENNSSTME